KGTLKTHDDAIDRFNSTPTPFEIVDNGWMPDHRIVFVDLPWVQEVRHATGEEGGSDGKRRYTNKTEIEAVCKTLSQFLPALGRHCHLQVLSPYRAQARRLPTAIRDEVALGRLANLNAPEFAIDKPKRTGATVDEFQGSEADIVVV